VRTALAALLPGDEVTAHAHLPISNWQPAPGGTDLAIKSQDSRLVMVAELKWCRNKRELGWTLWDIYKLIAAKEEHHADAAYAIVGAPDGFWADEKIDCSSLFASESWSSRELFGRYWRAWHDLLHGGSARPLHVPSAIKTTRVADAS